MSSCFKGSFAFTVESTLAKITNYILVIKLAFLCLLSPLQIIYSILQLNSSIQFLEYTSGPLHMLVFLAGHTLLSPPQVPSVSVFNKHSPILQD